MFVVIGWFGLFSVVALERVSNENTNMDIR